MYFSSAQKSKTINVDVRWTSLKCNCLQTKMTFLVRLPTQKRFIDHSNFSTLTLFPPKKMVWQRLAPNYAKNISFESNHSDTNLCFAFTLRKEGYPGNICSVRQHQQSCSMFGGFALLLYDDVMAATTSRIILARQTIGAQSTNCIFIELFRNEWHSVLRRVVCFG